MKTFLLILLITCSSAYCYSGSTFIAPKPLPESTFKESKIRGQFIEGYRQGYALSFFRSQHQLKRLNNTHLRNAADQRGKEIYTNRFDAFISKGFTSGFLTGANDFYRESIWPSMTGYVETAVQQEIKK